MSWYPQDKVKEAVDVYLDYYTSGAAEDVIWSRHTEYEFLPCGTKTDHDAGMINKVSRLQADHPLLPKITGILMSLPFEQYTAVLATYRFVGLNMEKADQKWADGRAYTDEDRAAKVGQRVGQFRDNANAGKKAIYKQLVK